jgi:D-alanyl-lipoteichoic acid acyltransferase DltB (MBOAT superfamily)
VLFTTLTFLVFLPIVCAAYWLIPRQRGRNALLVAASYFFYGWWDARFAVLMAVASFVDFVAALVIDRTESPGRRRALLAGSCTVSLGLLGYFKYAGFLAENALRLAEALGVRMTPFELKVVLPVGISFYTFQTLSYVIDVYRRQMRPTRSLIDYMAYVSFFPQLVAGPIERAGHLLPQFGSLRGFDEVAARDGLRLMAWGFFKKMVMADALGVVADAAYQNVGAADGPTLVFATVCFAFQIYCDFSAYSDIASGCARLFGLELMRNFAYPYFSRGVAEFWRRWHISLSTWFADYVYVPLGGSRHGRIQQARNVLVTFLLSGLWHGASWNFVVWGALNGLAVLPGVLWPRGARATVRDVPGGEANLPSIGSVLAMAGTFVFIGLTWVFFRASTLPDALTVLARMRAGPWGPLALTPAWNALGRVAYLLPAFVTVEWLFRRERHPLQWMALPRPVRWLGYSTLIWLTLWQAQPTTGAFIYFQF